jgi:hypothetical protein
MAKSKKRKPRESKAPKAPAAEDYAVSFARQFGISPEEARKLIRLHGPQRAEAIALENKLSMKPNRYQ